MALQHEEGEYKLEEKILHWGGVVPVPVAILSARVLPL